MSDSANLVLPYLSAAQAQKHVTHNDALEILDAVVQLSVKDRDLTAPPGGESEGDRYIPAATATGAWAGQEGNIAHYVGGAWEFYTPREGWRVWVDDEDVTLLHDGANWVADGGNFADGSAAAPSIAFASDPDTGLYRVSANLLGIAAGGALIARFGAAGIASQVNGSAAAPSFSFVDDPDTGFFRNAANELAIAAGGAEKIRATATQIVFTSGNPLFNRLTDDIVITLNKQAAADDAGFTFQTNFSTRALFGTLASDDFYFKVSPDGSSFVTAILIDKDDGAMTFGAADLVAAQSLNQAQMQLHVLEEELTALAGASVDSTIQIPNGAVVFNVSERVTTTITGATSFSVGTAAEPSKFGSGLGLAAGSTNVGVIGPTAFYADTAIRLTAAGSNFTGGAVRIAIHYYLPQAPQS